MWKSHDRMTLAFENARGNLSSGHDVFFV